MKWTIQELIKNRKTNNEFHETVDLSVFKENSDIVKISPVEVRGDYEIYDDTDFEFLFDVKCTITMLCAITLEEVDIEIDFEAEETFSTEKNDDFIHIDGITIDLLPIIWSNIILEKPMRVLSENAQRDFEKENVEIDTENINQAFAKLKNFKD